MTLHMQPGAPELANGTSAERQQYHEQRQQSRIKNTEHRRHESWIDCSACTEEAANIIREGIT
jgi:hypothetical protein